MTIAKRIKKAALPSPPLLPRRPANAQRKRWEVLELDELWRFVDHKKRKVWQSLPTHYRHHCWSFTDQWKVYAKVLPRWQHRPCSKGEEQTSIVEAINYSLRQRCGVLVRKSYSFSKSLAMHTARIKIVIDNYNPTLQ